MDVAVDWPAPADVVRGGRAGPGRRAAAGCRRARAFDACRPTNCGATSARSRATSFNGRGVGEPGNRAAEEFICATLRQNGVTPAGADGSCYQPVDVYRPVLGSGARLDVSNDDGRDPRSIWRRQRLLSPAGNRQRQRHRAAACSPARHLRAAAEARRLRARRTRAARSCCVKDAGRPARDACRGRTRGTLASVEQGGGRQPRTARAA